MQRGGKANCCEKSKGSICEGGIYWEDGRWCFYEYRGIAFCPWCGTAVPTEEAVTAVEET